MVCVEHQEVSCRLHGGQSLGSSCDQRLGLAAWTRQSVDWI